MPENCLMIRASEEREKGEAAVASVESELLFFVKEMNEIFLLVDEDRRIVAASDLAWALLGRPATGEGRAKVDDYFPRVYIDAIFRRVQDDEAKQMSLTFPVRDQKGGEVLLETRFNWIPFNGRDLLSLSCRDINGYIETISDLSAREDLYRTIFHESPLGFVHVNSDGIITDCNAAFLSIFGFAREVTLGVSLAEENDLGMYPRFIRAAMDALVGVNSRHEAQFQTSDGTYGGWVRVSFTSVRSDNQAFLGAVGIVEDITEAKRAIEKLGFVSSHDALTGLYNRRACEEAIAFMDREEFLPLGVIYADLNCLKLANDAFGHEEGDLLLRAAADIMRKSVSANDSVYRWGGDEFIILLRNADGGSVAAKVREIAKTCASWSGEGFVRPSMALGHAMKLFAEQDIDEVIKEAEDEMYANKLRDGRPTRLRILGTLEARLHNMMNCAMGNRSRRMILWGEWAIRNLGISEDLEMLRLLCRYHDIGVLAVPEEVEIIRADPAKEKVASLMQHMAIGYRIARSIAEIAKIAEPILYHHEWWDGMGYPNQLKGEEIPFVSRVISIFDAMEGMISLQPEGESPSFGNVLHSLEAGAGRQFDPYLVRDIVGKLRKEPPEFVNNLEV